jgi:hypothetical protein
MNVHALVNTTYVLTLKSYFYTQFVTTLTWFDLPWSSSGS